MPMYKFELFITVAKMGRIVPLWNHSSSREYDMNRHVSETIEFLNYKLTNIEINEVELM